jgi:hypothetical protein
MYIDIMYMYINTYEYIYLKIFVLKILYINSKQNIFLFIYLSTFPGYFFILLFFMILLVYLLYHIKNAEEADFDKHGKFMF